ncbi:PEPxxWA-CTERM sorting domain-containing protein [Sphingomonas tabacisoli]|uniref:PEPxxWA-CTERM sorting domain-containing protein n=1 Tax=Sphingomonas tabacisoli TaxID=2249466 RepID=A0ABW4I579_9SPHN
MLRVLGTSAPFALLACLATPASAQDITGVSVTNLYGTRIGDTSGPTLAPGGSTATVYKLDDPTGAIGVNYTAVADTKSFFFLHDNYCVGYCGTASKTTIAFTISNPTDAPVDLRFDSLITPGHMAAIFGSSNISASFTFNVRQITGEVTRQLYNASGNVSSEGIFLDSGGLHYNGLNSQSDSDGRWETLDWGATTLALPLSTIGAFSSTTLIYEATYQSQVTDFCDSVYQCAGAQVVFGDPRNDGGVTNIAGGGDLAALALNDPTGRPIIGGTFDPTTITYRVVPVGTDLPPDPDPFKPITYGGPFFVPNTNAVPEPATWAMMIGGFGLLGATTRRRRRLAIA